MRRTRVRSHFAVQDQQLWRFWTKDDGLRESDTSTARKYGGTGLGLAIATKLVHLMGGSIWADSPWTDSAMGEPVGGSAFHFTARFGLVGDAADLELPEVRGLPVPIAAAAGAPYRPLVVDSDLPGMSGIDLAERIRQDTRVSQTPILLLHCAGRREGEDRCQERASWQAEPRRVRPYRILLAEDNAVNQKLAKRLLEKQGHTVLIAADGEEAVSIAGRETLNLILLDVQMSNMDGLEATSLIRRREKAGCRAPIIALTAHAMSGDRERCLAAGMDAYVSKPIQVDELGRAMEELVAS